MIELVNQISIILSSVGVIASVVLAISASRTATEYMSASTPMYMDAIENLKQNTETYKRKLLLFQIVNVVLTAISVIIGVVITTDFVVSYMNRITIGYLGLCVLSASVATALINPMKAITNKRYSIYLCDRTLATCTELLMELSQVEEGTRKHKDIQRNIVCVVSECKKEIDALNI